MKKNITILILVAIITSCTYGKTEGVLVNKIHFDETSFTTYDAVTHQNIERKLPEKFIFVVESQNSKTIREYNVTEQTFNKYKIGDYLVEKK